jgi:hypothetical protein
MDEMFSRYLVALSQTEWLPPDRLARYQQGLTRRVARFAYDNVPFYRDRLGCLFAGEEAELARWSEVPILGRAEAMAHIAVMRSAVLPPEYGGLHESRTTGSTGFPLDIVANDPVVVSANAALTRLARWWGVDTARALASLRVYQQNPPVYPEGRDAKGWSFANPEADAYELDLMTPPEQQLEWLLRKQAPYWRTTASNALSIAYAATPEQARALGVELIFVGPLLLMQSVSPLTLAFVEERTSDAGALTLVASFALLSLMCLWLIRRPRQSSCEEQSDEAIQAPPHAWIASPRSQ